MYSIKPHCPTGYGYISSNAARIISGHNKVFVTKVSVQFRSYWLAQEKFVTVHKRKKEMDDWKISLTSEERNLQTKNIFRYIFNFEYL